MDINLKSLIGGYMVNDSLYSNLTIEDTRDILFYWRIVSRGLCRGTKILKEAEAVYECSYIRRVLL